MNLVKAKNVKSLIAQILVAFLAFILAACGKTSPKAKSKNNQSFSKTFFKENPFAVNPNWVNLVEAGLVADYRAKTSTITGYSTDLMLAQAACQCLPKMQDRYLRDLALARGVLPEALSPAVRETVKQSGVIKAIQTIPGLGSLSSLMSLFMSDKKLAKEIRSSLDKRISQSMSVGNNSLSASVPYNFDLFKSLTAKDSAKLQFAKSFHVEELATKWINTLADSRLWEQYESGQGFSDSHALQVLTLANVVAEMTYLYGLDPAESGARYGGLAIDPFKSMTQFTRYVEGGKNQYPIVSGEYTLSIPEQSSINLALEANESWNHSVPAGISLLEQARFLHGMGLAYYRLQPSKRNPGLAKLFASSEGGFFPSYIHKMPLVGLASIAGLLSKGYVDLANFSIRQFPKLSETDQETAADLPSLLALVEALNVWVVVLEDSQYDELPIDIAKQIEESKPTLKDALRLAVQNIVARHVTHGKVNGFNFSGFKLVLSKNDMRPVDFSTYARTIAVLAGIDQTSFQESVYISTDLRVKIVELSHGFVQHYLKPMATTGDLSAASMSSDSLIWTYLMLQRVGKYNPETLNAAWIQDLFRQISELLRSVSGEVL